MKRIFKSILFLAAIFCFTMGVFTSCCDQTSIKKSTYYFVYQVTYYPNAPKTDTVECISYTTKRSNSVNYLYINFYNRYGKEECYIREKGYTEFLFKSFTPIMEETPVDTTIHSYTILN